MVKKREIERLLEEVKADDVEQPQQGLITRMVKRQVYLLEQECERQRLSAWVPALGEAVEQIDNAEPNDVRAAWSRYERLKDAMDAGEWPSEDENA